MNMGTLITAMVDHYHGSHRDINHFLKVYGYAKAIGEGEGLDPQTQEVLEVTAVIHDIPCPLCREKYGSSDGKYQELEGPALARAFLQALGAKEALIDRACFLVGHHHTYTGVDGPDYQILLEADFLVNAQEKDLSKEAILAARQAFFRTKTGIHLLNAAFQLGE